jgi:hypothetical protein
MSHCSQDIECASKRHHSNSRETFSGQRGNLNIHTVTQKEPINDQTAQRPVRAAFKE